MVKPRSLSQGPKTSPPCDISAYLSASALRDLYRSNYIADGVVFASSRHKPAHVPVLAEGAWEIYDTPTEWGHEIRELVSFSPRRLEPTEFSWDDPRGHLAYEGRWRDVQRYARWIKSGLVPPPISVVEDTSGTLRVTDGHRRLAAADLAGFPVLAWVSWRTLHPELGSVRLTYEIAMAAKPCDNPGGPMLDAQQRAVLDALLERAEQSGDDWGTTQAVQDYLAEPEDDIEQYLVRVYKDVDWHLGHAWEDEEDDDSAARARASIQQAIDDLRQLRQDHPARVAKALARINAHRRSLWLAPLAPGQWSDDDILAEAERLPNPGRNPRKDLLSW